MQFQELKGSNDRSQPQPGAFTGSRITNLIAARATYRRCTLGDQRVQMNKSSQCVVKIRKKQQQQRDTAIPPNSRRCQPTTTREKTTPPRVDREAPGRVLFGAAERTGSSCEA